MDWESRKKRTGLRQAARDAGKLAAYPWLPAPDLAGAPIAALKAHFEQREQREAMAAHCALVESFTGALATLIGMRLTTQFFERNGQEPDPSRSC